MTETAPGFEGVALPTSVRRIGRYELLGEIARGGMGAVYKARDPASGQVVALKVMLEVGLSRPNSRKRFEREVQALAKVRHPNVVETHDSGQTSRGEPYIAMEWVEGGSLQHRLERSGQLDVGLAVRFAAMLCAAVQACHDAGVLHRDLKPANVLVARDGTLKLTDFGLVRDTDPTTSRTQLSRDGAFLGTPGFWAPEQASGALDSISERTDVYGVGATLFALLTGRPPHLIETMQDVYASLDVQAPAPSTLNPRVPRWLDRAVRRALANDPARRFASVEELASALSAGATHPPRRAILTGLVLLSLLLALSLAWPRGASVEATAVATAYERGLAEFRAGRLEEALAEFSQATRLDPTNASAWAGQGAARGGLGRWQGAIEAYDVALRLDPTYSEVWADRGAARAQLGDLPSAIEDLDEAIRLNPSAVAAWGDRGAARMTLGDDEGALTDLDEAIRLDPTRALFWYSRGAARANLGDHRGAVENWERALQLEPEAVWAPQARQWLAELR